MPAMKRLILSIFLVTLVSICYAIPPRLACEVVFSRADIRTEGHRIVSNKSDDNYFRSVTAVNDSSLLSEIKSLVEKDKARASNVMEGYKNGKEYIVLNIPNNGCIINVGMWWTDSGYVHLFVQSELKAFK